MTTLDLDKPIDFYAFPLDIQMELADYYEFNKHDVPPKCMSIREVLSTYLEWNGIIGYTDKILSIVKGGE